MSELRRRAAPGLALAGAALATVWLFDPALRQDQTPTQAGAAEPSGSTSSGSAAADPGGSTTADPAPAAGDCTTAAQLTGDSVMTRWGPVQVRAQVTSDGTLCDVQAVAYPSDDRRSAEINARAIPHLDAQAAELGVQFQAVSGATYTSEAYRESLQSILDQM